MPRSHQGSLPGSVGTRRQPETLGPSLGPTGRPPPTRGPPPWPVGLPTKPPGAQNPVLTSRRAKGRVQAERPWMKGPGDCSGNTRGWATCAGVTGTCKAQTTRSTSSSSSRGPWCQRHCGARAACPQPPAPGSLAVLLRPQAESGGTFRVRLGAQEPGSEVLPRGGEARPVTP